MIFVFPGQGSQKIGMCKDIYEAFSSARDVFHEVNDSISFNLSRLIFNGSEDELKLTQNTQPALMTVSVAMTKVMKDEFGLDITKKATYFAGHSLGEYTALCVGGVLSLRETAKILKIRAEAMASAFPTNGAMAAILGLDFGIVQKILDDCSSDGNFVQIANDNCDGQTIISGHATAVSRAMKKATEANAKKTVLLEVSGPFHSKLMEKAAGRLFEALDSVSFVKPSSPIISNVTAKAEDNNLKELLIKQLTNPVRWRESIKFAAQNGITKCIEIGSGKVLTGLVKRIAPEMEPINLESIESLENFALNFR